MQSSNGSTWSNASYALYYRLEDANTKRKFHFFQLKQASYAVDERADGSNSRLYMNGERGRATAGAASSLTDSDNGMLGSWTDDQWNGWFIRITKGTGLGQWRLISDSTSAGVITIDTAWDINPDATSDYVIYGGKSWQEISLSLDSISAVVKDVAVFHGMATLAQGENTPAIFVSYEGGNTPPDHEGDNAPNDNRIKIDLLHVTHKPSRGAVLWLARNSDMTVTRMDTFSWGAPSISKFSKPIKVGGKSWDMINMTDMDGRLFVMKVNGLYAIANDRATKLNIGLGLIKSYNNGQAMVSHNSSLYFSWGDFALQRLIGRDMLGVGPERGIGFPDERRAAVVNLKSHPEGLLACLDAGDEGVSSLMMYTDDQRGWHEIFRAWESGLRLDKISWQNNLGTHPRLWISVGGELVYQVMPRYGFNPLSDSSLNYQHESIIVAADMDMGAARLPKLIKELSLISENLSSGIEVRCEYQLDERIGTDEWASAGTFYTSPQATLALQRGDVRKIRYRLRLLTNDASTPPIVRATILEAFARIPLKYQWRLQIKLGDNQLTLQGGKDHDPDAFTNWLKDAARNARRIHMRARWEQMDDIYVIVEPPTLLRNFTNRVLGWWGGTLKLNIREA